MHAQVMSLYSFHPSKLSSVERSKKSAEMDYFWNQAKLDPEKSLPLLRVELKQAPAGSFFLTDGSELLLSLSRATSDRELAAASLAKADLNDTQSDAYFYAVHNLAVEDINVTDAALHILDDSRFIVSVPQHAMTLNQSIALMYLLLSMQGDAWIKPAKERFAKEKNTGAMLSLVSAFGYAQTDEADAALKRIAEEPSYPDAVRREAREILDEGHKATKGGMKIKGTIAEIREQRRQRLRAVSDEALVDVQWMTRRIAQLRAVPAH